MLVDSADIDASANTDVKCADHPNDPSGLRWCRSLASHSGTLHCAASCLLLISSKVIGLFLLLNQRREEGSVGIQYVVQISNLFNHTDLIWDLLCHCKSSVEQDRELLSLILDATFSHSFVSEFPHRVRTSGLISVNLRWLSWMSLLDCLAQEHFSRVG